MSPGYLQILKFEFKILIFFFNIGLFFGLKINKNGRFLFGSLVSILSLKLHKLLKNVPIYCLKAHPSLKLMKFNKSLRVIIGNLNIIFLLLL